MLDLSRILPKYVTFARLILRHMKILLINNIYAPYDRGGAEQVVKKTIDELLAHGHQVVLITGTPDGEEVVTDERCTIYRIHPNNIYFYTSGHRFHVIIRFFWHLLNLSNVFVLSKIKKILIEESPDIVHTHNLMGLSFLIPSLIRTLNIRHIHTVHDVQLVEPSGMIIKQKETCWRYNGLPTKLYTTITKKLFGSPDVVISPSQFLHNFYASRGFFKKSQCVVIRNPIPFSTYEIETNKKVSNSIHFLYVGQIEKHKGIDILVEAFLQVKNEDIRLNILGSGSQLEYLTDSAKNDTRIIFHGRATRQKVADFFKKSDVTVVPSLCYENSPTVIFESFFFGVPVLASKMEGIAELIEEGKNGITFEAGNREELTQKIEELDREKIYAMSENAKKVIEHMEKNPYIEQLLGIYNK